MRVESSVVQALVPVREPGARRYRKGGGLRVPLIRSAVSRDLDLDLLDVEIGPRDPAFGTPLRWSDLAIAAVALAGAAAAVAVVATGGVAADPSTFAAVLVANVLALAGGGLLWRYGRPTSAFGYLLLGEAVLVLVSSLAGSSSPV